MTTLNRKLFRDVRHLKGQLFAASLVVMCGVASFVTMRSAYNSLLNSQQAYYSEYRFADLFARVKRAPQSVVDEIRSIEGVASVRTRIVTEVTLDVPRLDEPATGRIVSMPDRRRSVINDIFIRSGRYFSPGRNDEVLISEAFADANGLAIGESLGAVINGAWEEFEIVGIALSPEYVYEIGEGDLLPDNQRFGVIWANRNALSAAYDMEGAFNDLSITLAHGANSQGVIESVDRILDPYGSIGTIHRREQTSHLFLESELEQLTTSGLAIPLIFLLVAAFILHIVLSRLVSTQRDQVAILKAFGYSNRSIGLHFLGFALVAVVFGGALGILFGLWAGSAITEVYTQFYRFPVLEYAAGAASVSAALLVSGGSALLGALSAVRNAVRLPPAEAMRPEAPARFTAGILERIKLQQVLPTSIRMIVRSLERNPWKAFFSSLGIALSVAILIIGRYTQDAVDVLMHQQFEGAQREDATVLFAEPQPVQTQFDLNAMPGVMQAEVFRVVPASLTYGHRERRVAITGIGETMDLRRIIDMDGEPRQPPATGMMVTRQLAEILGARPGDSVTVEVLQGKQNVRSVVIARTVEEFSGLNAYMSIDQVWDMLGEGEYVSGAYLMVDESMRDEFNDAVKRTPAIAGSAFRVAALESFKDTVATSQSISRTVMIFFACVIAIGVIYNSARISLSERGRELASLRVLGFRKGEVALFLLGEQAVLTLLALPIGYGLGWMMLLGMVEGFESELFRFPLVVSSQTIAFATLVTLIAATFSGILVRRRIFNLDLISVMKTRE